MKRTPDKSSKRLVITLLLSSFCLLLRALPGLIDSALVLLIVCVLTLFAFGYWLQLFRTFTRSLDEKCRRLARAVGRQQSAQACLYVILLVASAGVYLLGASAPWERACQAARELALGTSVLLTAGVATILRTEPPSRSPRKQTLLRFLWGVPVAAAAIGSACCCLSVPSATEATNPASLFISNPFSFALAFASSFAVFDLERGLSGERFRGEHGRAWTLIGLGIFASAVFQVLHPLTLTHGCPTGAKAAYFGSLLVFRSCAEYALYKRLQSTNNGSSDPNSPSLPQRAGMRSSTDPADALGGRVLHLA
jgi:hypothetical protein